MVNLIAVLLVVIASLFASLGSMFLKKGAKNVKLNIQSWILNKSLYIGVFIEILSASAYITALSMEELSVIYPLSSLSYVWISIISAKFLKEKMNYLKWTGIALIMIGVMLIV